MSSVIEQTDLPDGLPEPGAEDPAPAPEEDKAAPYGRDESGEPIAPYGYKANGDVKKRPGRPSGSGGGSTRTSGGGGSVEKYRKPLEQRLTEYLGAPLVMVSPIAAAVWEERVEQTANAILVLASGSVRWRKWLERFVKGSAAGDLGITFGGVITGIMVDSGRVSPDGKMAQFYGIPEIYTRLYGAYVGGQNGEVEARGLYTEV